MAATIGPADSELLPNCRAALLSFPPTSVQQRFATHTTFCWMFQQKWRRSGNDPRQSLIRWEAGKGDDGPRPATVGRAVESP